MKIPRGYRQLNIDEIIKNGDLVGTESLFSKIISWQDAKVLNWTKPEFCRITDTFQHKNCYFITRIKRNKFDTNQIPNWQ